MNELPNFEPSKVISVRLPAVVLQMLKEQRPWEKLGHTSMNNWLAVYLKEQIDWQKAGKQNRYRWQLTDQMPRAGRR